MHQRYFPLHRRLVEHHPWGEAVEGVDDGVRPLQDVGHVLFGDLRIDRDHLDVPVQGAEAPGGACHLRCADVRVPVEELAVQVGEGDGVKIDDDQSPHPGGREVRRRR